MMPFFLIIAALIAVLAILFALENAVPVTITFFSAEYQSTLAMVLVLSLMAGIILGLLVLVPRLVRQKLTISNLNKRLKTLEKDLAARMPAAGETPDEAAGPDEVEPPAHPGMLK